MIQVRATKYDPGNRDVFGHYAVDEYTSVSDIGSSFDGKILTTQEYLTIEDAYVATVRRLLTLSNVGYLYVTDLENWHRDTTTLRHVEFLRPSKLSALHDGLVVRGGDIDRLVRLVLRELVWCRLAGPHGLYVHFGYDYYIFLGCKNLDAMGPVPPGMYYEYFHPSPCVLEDE